MKVALNGAAGAMGKRIISLLARMPDAQLVAALEWHGHPDIGKDAGVLAGVEPAGVAVAAEMRGEPDVLIDFSTPEAAMERARECAGRGVAVVIGTTGLSAAQRAEIEQQIAPSVPVLVGSNMSVGVNLLFDLVARVAAQLPAGYDIEIIEAHHRRKKDAPSGTALELARRICAALERDPASALIYGREGAVGERTPEEIAIHAVRGGDIVGDHTVIFAGEGERLELTHRASSRDVFARGALEAARFLAGRSAGLYNMHDVLASGPDVVS